MKEGIPGQACCRPRVERGLWSLAEGLSLGSQQELLQYQNQPHGVIVLLRNLAGFRVGKIRKELLRVEFCILLA